MLPRKIKVVDVINDVDFVDVPQQTGNDIKAIENTDTINGEKPAIEN